MIKVTLWMLFLAVLCYTGFCLMLYFKQRTLLFYPVTEVDSKEADAIFLQNGDQSLKIWKVGENTERALIYFGGNAEDVSVNIPLFKKMFPDYSLFLLNYRGYGGSSGEPSEEALFSDALVLYDFLAQKYESISVMGRSLGTGVCVYLASKRDTRNLVLVTPYDSMANLAASYYPLVPVKYLMKDRFDAALIANKINIRTLVLIAEFDEVIPRKNSDILVSKLDDKMTEVAIISGANHNNIGMFPVYLEKVQIFLSPDH